MTKTPFIPLPSPPKIVEQSDKRAVFEIEPLYPGYGVTLGNALRRALLSSLEGAAVTTVRFEQVPHEFTTIAGVRETVLDIVLNIKQLRFTLYGDEPQMATVQKKGAGVITGADIKVPSQIKVVSPEVRIAELTDQKASLIMELRIEKGVGYVPAAARDLLGEKLPVGTVAVDALFSPVHTVNFDVESMRFRDRTDYNRLKLTIETDGSLGPEEAFQKAVSLLVQQFAALGGIIDEPATKPPSRVHEPEKKPQGGIKQKKTALQTIQPKRLEGNVLKQSIAVLGLSGRVGSALKAAGIQTVAGLVRRRPS